MLETMLESIIDAAINTRKVFGWLLARYKTVTVKSGLTLPAMYVCAGLDYAKGDPVFVAFQDRAYLLYDRKYRVRFVMV